MEKLLGFLPDADPTTPGVITACTNFIPYVNGMKGAPAAVTPSGVPALGAACIGAAVVTKLDDSRRIFAGTTTAIYELVAGVWTDRSAFAYAGGADTRWSYAQFGDSTIAANLSDYIQRSTTGAFATIATAPKAKIVFSVGSFVMALNTNDATYGVQPDRWWCCGTYDDTTWTPSLSTLATTARLVSTPGQITAGGRLGEYAIAYKDKAIYLGQFVGAPSVWDWIQVPGGEAGCVGQDAWCDVGGAHFIVGSDNFYLFDGSRPAVIGTGEIRQWFYDNSEPSYRYKTKCVFDRQNDTVWIFFCSVGASTNDQAIAYHMRSKQWGRATYTNEAALNYVAAGVTIDDLTTYSATIDGLSSYSFDSQFWLSGGKSLALFNSSHQLQSITGDSVSSGFTTGDIGDDDRTSLLTRARLRYAPGFTPTTSTAQANGKMNLGDSLTAGPLSSASSGKFDLLQEARFHRIDYAFTGPVRVLAASADLSATGSY